VAVAHHLGLAGDLQFHLSAEAVSSMSLGHGSLLCTQNKTLPVAVVKASAAGLCFGNTSSLPTRLCLGKAGDSQNVRQCAIHC
jgi:hypothetical protein